MKSYKVKVNALYIRKGPNKSFPSIGVIKDKGVYPVSTKRRNYGKLADRAGWICLDFTEQVD